MTLQVHSPYDNSLVAELALDTDASVEEKLERARAAQANWRGVPVAERVAPAGPRRRAPQLTPSKVRRTLPLTRLMVLSPLQKARPMW